MSKLNSPTVKTTRIFKTERIPAKGKGRIPIVHELEFQINEIIFVPLVGRAEPCLVTSSNLNRTTRLMSLYEQTEQTSIPKHIGVVQLAHDTGEYITETNRCRVGAHYDITYSYLEVLRPGLVEFIPHIWRVEHKEALLQLAETKRWKITKATDVADLAKEADYPLAVYDLATIYGQDFPTQFKIISAKDVKLPNWK
jgi:hypothetical protein